MIDMERKYYIFQENSLLIPEQTADSEIHKPIELGPDFQQQFNSSLDIFSFSSVDDPENIVELHAISIKSNEPVLGWKQIPLRQLINIMNSGNRDEIPHELSRILRAYHIAEWRKTTKYCGCCGSINNDSKTETARLCPACGQLEFPRIAPAIITLIVNEKNEVLLAHNIKFIEGMYSLIAGFNEAGESLEATVKREIKEEISLDVKDITYIKSQPWPFPDSLMVGFFARHAGGDIKVDGREIEDAQWFSKQKLPLIPAHGSVSRFLIELWLKGDLQY